MKEAKTEQQKRKFHDGGHGNSHMRTIKCI